MKNLQITARGGKALAVTTDVSDAKDIALLRDQAVERFGKVDVWINNVGVGALGFFWDFPIEDHARILDVRRPTPTFQRLSGASTSALLQLQLNRTIFIAR
jgi:NAD(P)-dependent dehydrogenase (short-subunit alcohol dehydrogenase family)